ncbi:MAG: ABC transporter permease [Mycetocola sp.]
MTRYILSKLGWSLFVVWAAYTLSFVLLYVLPSDPVDLLFDPNDLDTISEADRQKAAAYYGFDQPVIIQYLTRLLAAVQGDFGTSIQTGQGVWAAIVQVLPQTIVLAGFGLAIAIVIASAVAFGAAYTTRPWLRNLLASLPPAGVSIPVFLVGLAILQVFSFQLHWFPPLGNDGFASLVLPAVTLAIPVSGPIAQLLVKNVSTELSKPYVTTALTKGGTRRWSLVHEVLKNASLPALTIAGLTFGNLLAGAVIVETIFSRSGLGRLTESAVRTQDIPQVQGIVVFAALVFVGVNFVVDIIYPLLDPRLKTRVFQTA